MPITTQERDRSPFPLHLFFYSREGVEVNIHTFKLRLKVKKKLMPKQAQVRSYFITRPKGKKERKEVLLRTVVEFVIIPRLVRQRLREKRLGTGVTLFAHRKVHLLFKYPRTFKRRTLFSIPVFFRELFAPLRERLEDKIVKCPIPARLRVLRWLLYMKGDSVSSLAQQFKQGLSSTYRDINRLSKLFALTLNKKWIGMPVPDSLEYNRLVDLFPLYDNVVYAADLTKFYCRRPTRIQSDFYCGHKHRHCLNVICFVDGSGIIRHVLGPEPGALQDVRMIKRSGLVFSDILRDGDKILYDGALSGDEWKKWVIAPHSTVRLGRNNRSELTSLQKIQDRFQRKSRIVVEHTFARVKQWKAVDPLTCSTNNAWQVIYCALLLSNVHCTYEHPIRSL